ncbi:glutathione synthetase [Anditalea andensis]|uniref:Glutathione synthetase n=1 Tax=Anditalea andensis TaxID=1048983 RepID=A0A074KRA3_9BACT|nr:glutathione synthetase [Anditalea andensis]
MVTCESMGDYNNNAESEDQILAALLTQYQLSFKFEIWSDKSVNWLQYTHIIIKSPWDYFDRYKEFTTWCSDIILTGIPVYNDISTVIWNADKKYLFDIESKGHRVIPTQYLSKSQNVSLNDAFEKFDTDSLIFKPSVSGGAKNTLHIIKSNWERYEDQIKELVQEEDFLLQPFIKEVVEEGEYSFIFFGGKFSHAVLKQPRAGDFRVQHFFGGRITSIKPEPGILADAQRIINDFAAGCLYARVDGVLIEGVFYLMELELIEPYLFLFTHPKAKHNYMTAILEKLA